MSVEDKRNRFSIRTLWNRRQFVSRALGAIAAWPLRGVSAIRRHPAGRLTLAEDPLRPQYHLLPAANWMNDPNGPVYWKGKYHLFYQYNPDAAEWGDMHWAHAMSSDMIHWEHLPIALSPNPNGPDRDGCFSGSTIIYEGKPTILYTGVATASPENATLRDGTHNFRETQCIATTNDEELRHWKQSAAPVIYAPPEGLAVTGFRDPCVWKDGSVYYMTIGSGIAKRGGCVLLYRSNDLRTWSYLHTLIEGKWNGVSVTDPVDSGEMWECPDFFQLGTKHVLLYSTQRKVYWIVGELDRQAMKFMPLNQGSLDSGDFYAPKSMTDTTGRRILWGWIPETRPKEQYIRAGWAGVMALPRVLTLEDDHLRIEPLQALRGLRKSPGGTRETATFHNFCGEVIARFGRSSHGASVQIGSPSKIYLSVGYDSLRPNSLRINSKEVPLLTTRAFIELHIFMDGSVIEIYIDGLSVHTNRVYDLDLATPQTNVNAGGLLSLNVWELRPVSENRLTI